MKRIGIEGSLAIAEAVKLCRADVIAAYPITPQTHIVERLAELVSNGELDGQYIPVESEHSALSACIGSSAVGARTFTATAGQGLELMHEVLFVTSSLRLPVVMVVANRALSGPLNIWGDHSDVMAARDCSWIQIFAENAQQAFDQVICSFKIAEDRSVLFPVMVNIDGFHVSHVIESLEMLEQEKIDNFLPVYQYPYTLDPAKPVTMGAFATPSTYTEAKKAQDDDLRASKKTIVNTWDQFYAMTGRKYLPVENYKTENTDTVLVTMGSYSETAMTAIDNLQEAGLKVGLVRIRLWRPFHFEEIKSSLGKAKTVIVLDRALSFGGPTGPVCSEIKSAFYQDPNAPKIISYVGGLGGRDISVETFENLIRQTISSRLPSKSNEIQMIEVRE
jgi:pyruvate ferredoxin oxidoreductase alpha subunit